MPVVAPIPSARQSTAAQVKPGFFSNWRMAKRRSFIGIGVLGLLFLCAASSASFNKAIARVRVVIDPVLLLQPVNVLERVSGVRAGHAVTSDSFKRVQQGL